MTLRQYLSVMSIATILCWFAFGVVIVNIDPMTTGQAGFFFFYASLYLSIVGTLALLFFFNYHWFDRPSQPLYKYVERSFRNGLLLATGLVVILFLQAHHLLRLWNLAIFVVLLTGILLLLWTKPKSSFK